MDRVVASATAFSEGPRPLRSSRSSPSCSLAVAEIPGHYHLSLIPIVESPGQMTEEAIIEAYIGAAEQTIREA